MLEFELNKQIDISLCTRGTGRKRKVYIGIYKITSPSGKIYIGQSVNIENRFAVYKNLTSYKNKARTSQRHLYNSFDSYGVLKHKFEIIHICTREELNNLEIHYVKLYAQYDNRPALNLREGGGSRAKQSDDTKKRIGQANSSKLFVPYEEFENWVRTNELTKNCKTETAWRKIARNLPEHIPNAPHSVYKNKGWKGFGVLFDTGNKHKGDFLNYEEAKVEVQKFARVNKVTSTNWKENVQKLPVGIPKNPQQYYLKEGTWKDWGDFLGTGNKHKGNFLSYEEAKRFAIANNIKTSIEWSKKTSKLPVDIPKDPEVYYKRQRTWNGWGDFLGTGIVANQNKKEVIYDYNKFVKWVQTCELILNKKIKSATELRDQWQKKSHTSKLPFFIPKSPRHAYKDKGWQGWEYLLNKVKVGNGR